MTIGCLVRSLFAAAIIGCCLPALAQEDALWAKRYGGSGSETDQAVAVKVDSAGNIYVAGTTNVYGNADYSLVKYNAAGVLVWERSYDGPANSHDFVRALVIDSKGNAIVTGSSDGGATLWDVATVKFSPTGQRLWVRRYNGQQNQYDDGYDVACDANDNIGVVGSARTSSTAGVDYVVIKYNPQGGVIYTRLFDAPNHNDDVAKAIAFDGAGNAFVTGSFHTVKYDAAGVRKWAKTYEDPNFSEGWYAEWKDVATDANGNAYVVGVVRTPNWYDYVIIAYDTNGVRKWVRTYDGPSHGWDGASAVVVDAQANVYVTGKSQSDVGSYNDYATLKYSPAGVRLWVKRYDRGLPEPYTCDDIAYGLALSPAGGVCVVGISSFITPGEWVDSLTTVRYDANGNQKWVRHYPSPHPAHSLTPGIGIAVNASGNPYIASMVWAGPARQFDFLVAKYSP